MTKISDLQTQIDVLKVKLLTSEVKLTALTALIEEKGLFERKEIDEAIDMAIEVYEETNQINEMDKFLIKTIVEKSK